MSKLKDFFANNFIDTQDWQKSDLLRIIETAIDLKKKFRKGNPTPYLFHKTLFLLFFFSSTRTRTSFEAAMDHLGGNSHDLVPERLQIDHGDRPKEMFISGRYSSSEKQDVRFCHSRESGNPG